MSLSVGIVGLPNVGKSTLFQALTKKQVDTSNYPFATIDPNVGVVAVPDERLEKLAVMSKSKKVVPTTVEFTDIAGLVKGASQGEGLGNKFLQHIRQVDAIVHVVRAFTDTNVIHVAGKIDPASDRTTILYELAMADLEQLTKAIDTTQGRAHAGDKEAAKFLVLLEKVKAKLDAGEPAASADLSDDDRALLKPLNLLTMKPMLTVLNVDEGSKKNEVRSKEQEDGSKGELPICAKLEKELAELSPDEAKAFLADLGWQESGLDRLIKASYELLGLITFLTTGEKESRAWTIRRGTKAPQAAGAIHSDFEKGFIRAEVINWHRLLDVGSWVSAREKGWIRLEGKEYVFQDGDVTEFHSSD